MTMIIRRCLYLLLSIGTAWFVMVNNGHAAVALPTCLPVAPIVAQVVNPQPQITGDRPMQSFYLLEMPDAWQKLVGLDTSGQCFDYIGQKTNYVTLTAFMPIELATELASQRWAKLSPDHRQSFMAASVRDRAVWLAPEEALAFQQLGYIIPSQAKVLPALNPYRFTRS